MNFGKRYISLQTAIIIFVVVVVIAALSATGILLVNVTADNIEMHQAEKAMGIAQTVSEVPLVKESLDENERSEEVQLFTNKIRHDTNLLFIVVMDMDGIRKTHPNADMIGKPFVGGDETRALKGEQYTSIAEGTLGPSLRAFKPVFNDAGQQIGAVSVGISLETVKDTVSKSRYIIYAGMGVGIFLGIIGAISLARRINRILFGLEPYKIASLLEERNAMLESVREGIIAVNPEHTIVVANKEAVRIFRKAGLPPNPVGKKVEEYLPVSRLIRILQSDRAEYDQESDINGLPILVNRVPVKVNGQTVGAISTFRDKSELSSLAEQLTGVRTYADALRAQTHEFMNILHVITGMLYIKEYAGLEKYLRKQTKLYQAETGCVSNIVKDPVIAGFLVSKGSYARENQVKLRYRANTPLPSSADPNTAHHMITIVGNLIENAFDAVKDNIEKQVSVSFHYDGASCAITVKDNGEGIAGEIRDHIFQKGESTKGSEKGFGLYNVMQSVRSLDGTITFESDEITGTSFIVKFPYKEEENDFD
ncbi:malate two-component sensor histidine kinase MalK [Bacillus freudenreichii]|nr:malate two-component sensor histidine kinase MalK [Bacillus freudenreichii]